MSQPRLYIFVGYPGAGKTTVAQIIQHETGAVHLWADKERLEMFSTPTHSPKESLSLYGHLNDTTASLLADGKDVIFDTNFNFRKDRDHLRKIAESVGALATVIWMTTPADVAKQRAVHDQNLRNGYEFPMSEAQFDKIAGHLEPPTEDEKIIKFDGTKVDRQHVIQLLGL